MNELKIKRDLIVKSLNNFGMIKAFEEIPTKNYILFKSEQNIYQGKCIILISVDESIYSTITICFATLNDVYKKEKVLKFINNLNLEYKSYKYFINDNNEILLQVPYVALAKDFNADLFVELIFNTYTTLKEGDYSKFMKLIWS